MVSKLRIDLSRNIISDGGVADMTKVLKKFHIRVKDLDLSNNHNGREGLLSLRWFLEEEEKLSFDKLDLSNNLA